MSQLCLKVKHLQAKQLLSQCSSHGRLVRLASNKKEDEPAKLPKTTKSLLAMKREKSLDPNTAKDDKTIIVGPDGIPYDYTKDMHYNDDLQFYRYPQYFTNYMTPQRVVNIIKEDFSLIHKHGRLHKVREELGTPREIDVAIFGGGAVGASIAYALKSRVPTGLSVAIFERDPTVSLIPLPLHYHSNQCLCSSTVHNCFNGVVGGRYSPTIFVARKHSHVDVYGGVSSKIAHRFGHLRSRCTRSILQSTRLPTTGLESGRSRAIVGEP